MAKATPPKGATHQLGHQDPGTDRRGQGPAEGGDASSKGKYKLAVNCKACHDIHKGK